MSQYLIPGLLLLAIAVCSSAAVAGELAPARHVRSDEQFIEKSVRLDAPEMAEVKKALGAGDAKGAWEALLKHYRGRKKPVDPRISGWSKTGEKAVARAVRGAARNLSAWRVKGKVDWEHGKRPPRKMWENYWGRNRLRFLGSWVPAAVASGRADLRQAAARTFLEWYRDCPPPKLPVKGWWRQSVDGFAWREIEVGIRGRLLLSVFMASRGWKDVPAEFHRSLLVSIQQHMDYLSSHFAKMGPRKGNHQAHHAPALVAAGVLLPEFKSSAAWKRLGLRILREHVKLDHDPQGVQKENSPSYHAGVLGLYLDPYEVLTSNGGKPPEWMARSLNLMADFLLHSTAPDGRLVPLNDCWPSPSQALRQRVGKVLGRPDMLAVEDGGKAAGAKPPPTSRAFKHAAFAFMRSAWDKTATCVVLDASNHASGHWHAGKPNLVIHAGSQVLACDPQLGNYDDPSFYRYFHTARGHNTVLVDGQGDGTPQSYWSYKHISRPKLTLFRAGRAADIARATTDGFRRLKPSVSFERTVVFVKPGLVFVHDVLVSKGEHDYEWLLHLVPQKPVVDRKAMSMSTALGGPFELFCGPAPGATDGLAGPKVLQGKYANRTGGMSAGRGKHWSPPEKGKKPALLVNAPYGMWKRRGRGRVTFDFVLQVLGKGKKPLAVERVKASAKSGAAAYRVRRRGGEVLIVFDDRSAKDRGPLTAGGLRLSGRVGVAVLSGPKPELLSDGKLSR